MKKSLVCAVLTAAGLLFVLAGCNKMTDRGASTLGSSNPGSSNQDSSTQSSSNHGSSNADSSSEVKPTGKADPVLKGTRWGTTNRIIDFAVETNMVVVSDPNAGLQEATYSVNGLTVSFDLTQYVQLHKSMTVDKHIKQDIAKFENDIAKFEKDLKAAQAANNKAEEKRIQKELERRRSGLEHLKNPTEGLQRDLASSVENMKQYAAKLEPFAKFTGRLNSEKTKLTIEKFPVGVWDGVKFDRIEIKTLIFTKN
ncbi:hypothetical protein [Treponema sp.]|uniref:hypothetical protein n=1 Tax=Treponema sp. TaxID=166 RepID=UPI003FA1EAF9